MKSAKSSIVVIKFWRSLGAYLILMILLALACIFVAIINNLAENTIAAKLSINLCFVTTKKQKKIHHPLQVFML